MKKAWKCKCILGFKVHNFKDQSSISKVQSSWFMVHGSRLKVKSWIFKVQESKYKPQASRFKVMSNIQRRRLKIKVNQDETKVSTVQISGLKAFVSQWLKLNHNAVIATRCCVYVSSRNIIIAYKIYNNSVYLELSLNAN